MSGETALLPARRNRIGPMLGQIGIFPFLIAAVCVVMIFVEPRFFSRLNLLNVLRNASFLSMLALGQMLVIIVGGFDISIGAVVALASVITALSMGYLYGQMPDAVVWVILGGSLAGIAVGAAVGMLNGIIVSRLKITPFMVTLGMTSIVLGTAFYLTKGVPIYGMPDLFTDVVGRGRFLELAYPTWVAILFILALWALLERAPFGRHVYAVGGNPQAVRASGIRIEPVLLFAYATAGLSAGIVGVLMTARIGSGQSTLDGTLAIESIAAAVVGGTSLAGGVGRVHQVVGAAVFLSILSNILNLARIDSRFQTLVLGAVVLVAALAEVRLRWGARHG
jgi:ribose transport system permease protein